MRKMSVENNSSSLPYSTLQNDSIALDQTSSAPQPPSTVVIQQPEYLTSSTTVVAQQPQPKRVWQSDIFDCFQDTESCCCVFWVGPCYLGSMAQRMGDDFCVGCCLQGLWPMRAVFRERHNIQGNMCDDCCEIYFCGSCVACQLAREMTYLGYPKNCTC